jgi:hypothetical protein
LSISAIAPRGVISTQIAILVVKLISHLHQHDVTMGEAIKLVEKNSVVTKAAADWRFCEIDLFSRYEIATGEPDVEK